MYLISIPILKVGLEGQRFLNSNPYLVIYNWKGIRARKVMTLRKGVFKILGQNCGRSKFTSCRTLAATFLGLRYKPIISTIVLFSVV